MLARHELDREGGWGRGLELSWFVYERRAHRAHQGSRQVVYSLWELAGPGRGGLPLACESPNMSKHHKM